MEEWSIDNPTSRHKWQAAERFQARIVAAEALVTRGQNDAALKAYEELLPDAIEGTLRAQVLNDLGVIKTLSGDVAGAFKQFSAALAVDMYCESAQYNLALLQNGLSIELRDRCHSDDLKPKAAAPASIRCRIAILSFLFNWPSTGGGIIHTVELAKFLNMAGYQVRHFFARNSDWGIGKADASLPIDSEALEFGDHDWNVSAIQASYRAAVDRFNPDFVIITDCWNFKPLLAEAMSGYPFILRQQALELACPLNNLRLLFDENGSVSQCPLHQLATPKQCQQCVQERGRNGGELHRVERELAGFGTPEYDRRLRWALQHAEVVLVLNPLVECLLSPHANNVRVATWGMDASRFPWPWLKEPSRHTPPEITTVMMAGVVQEGIKGFHVLQQAGELLWQRRQDFSLVVTGDPVGRFNAFTQFIGWISQEDLPRKLRAADIVVVPTIAQDGLSRTSVEAMGVGRPVVASRIGGLPYTVMDGSTGLLCHPNDPVDLARKIERLLDDPVLRKRMGDEGRRRFEEEFTWERVIERDYSPLFARRRPVAN